MYHMIFHFAFIFMLWKRESCWLSVTLSRKHVTLCKNPKDSIARQKAFHLSDPTNFNYTVRQDVRNQAKNLLNAWPRFCFEVGDAELSHNALNSSRRHTSQHYLQSWQAITSYGNACSSFRWAHARAAKGQNNFVLQTWQDLSSTIETAKRFFRILFGVITATYHICSRRAWYVG